MVVAALGVVAYNKIPLHDTRPAEPPTPLYSHSPQDAEDIEARLWEDPIAAVARARHADPEHDKSARHQAGYLKNRLGSPGHAADLRVIGVMVSGAPYAADNETRRRTRYAVIAGLHRAGFAPQNSEHVGYFLLPADSPDLREPLSAVVYEYLTAEDRGRDAAVLLLWLNQDAFRDRPLAEFAAAAALATGNPPSASLTLIGPTDSDGLRAMYRELQGCPPTACLAGADATHPLAVYSSTATAADEWVLDEAHAECAVDATDLPDETSALHAAFDRLSNHAVQLYRTAANDCSVSRLLYRELRRRGVSDPGEITLIAERDSLYSRLMGRYFGGCDGPAGAAHPTCFTYLRGLDGLGPSVPPAAGTGSAGADGDAPAKANPPAAPDVSSGPAQLDYLRRLAVNLAANLRTGHCRAGAGGVCAKAIGILGSDVYDKVIILQALRGYFPRAVFFTTDLDALLFDAQNLNWTQHLLIGSAYGLRVRPELQGDIPPFRSTYQTAAYLATLLAVGRDAAMSRHLADRWSANPRLLEIGRRDAFDLTGPQASPQSTCAALAACTDVSPPTVQAFWVNARRITGFRVACVILAALLAGGLIAFPRRADAARVPWWAVAAGSLAFLAAFTTAWPSLAGLAAGGGGIAPPVLSGASIWAGVFVEAAAILAVFCLGVRGQRALNQNATELSRLFSLHDPELLRRAYREAQGGDRALADSLSPVERLVGRYLHRGRWWWRGLRVVLATAVSVMVLVAVGQAVGTSYIEVGDLTPIGTERRIAASVSYLSLFVIQLLVFGVADAMLLSRSFILDLSKARPDWPSAALAAAATDWGLSSGPASAWLMLRMVAARTACVVDLVWYPSLVLFAMAVAAFTVEFGPAGFASNPVSLVISTLVVVAAALLLRHAAESLRGAVLRSLADCRSRALSQQDPQSGRVAQLDQLLERVRDFDEGAFAPYSQQPLVKALLIPAATYGGNLLLQYLGVAGL